MKSQSAKLQENQADIKCQKSPRDQLDGGHGKRIIKMPFFKMIFSMSKISQGLLGVKDMVKEIQV